VCDDAEGARWSRLAEEAELLEREPRSPPCRIDRGGSDEGLRRRHVGPVQLMTAVGA
jgi:hypothetical protein